MDNAQRRLLILSCSQAKRPNPGILPAIERYDGPAFRILRRFLRERNDTPLDVYIVSAEFGLIPSGYPVPLYDRVMNRARASELLSTVQANLEAVVGNGTYDYCLIYGGKTYQELILASQPEGGLASVVAITRGGQGGMAAGLHDWLHGKSVKAPKASSGRTLRGNPVIRGVEITVTREQASELAQAGLQRAVEGVGNFKSWYVAIGEGRVAPKWLVSQISGLPLKSFTTDDARRVLADLGLEVRRV